MSPRQLRSHLHQRPSDLSTGQAYYTVPAFLHDPSILWCLQQSKLHLHQRPTLPLLVKTLNLPQNVKPQFLSIASSCLQSQHHVRDSPTLFAKLCCQLEMHMCFPYPTSYLVYAHPAEMFPQIFHLRDADLLSITADFFSVQLTTIHCPQKSKDFISPDA